MCRKHGAATPTFREQSGFLTVTFKAQMVANVDPGGVRGLAEQVGRRLVEGLADTQRKVLNLMRENPSISKRELAAEIGISTTAIDKNIASLKAKEMIRRIGPDKGGHWKVAE